MKSLILFDLSLDLDRTLAQRKAKLKVKATQCPTDITDTSDRMDGTLVHFWQQLDHTAQEVSRKFTTNTILHNHLAT